MLRMFLSLLPTKQNKENFKRDQQLIHLIEHEPELMQGVQASELSDVDIAQLQARLDATTEKPRYNLFENLYHRLYFRITRNWDKGLDALTDARRAELLSDCRRTP